MVKKKTNDSLTVNPPEQTLEIPVDEYHGMGGSYVLDPESGKRVRIEGPAVQQGPTEQELEKMEAIDDESK